MNTQQETTITKSQIISDLEAGLSRKEMREKYHMSIAQVTAMINTFGLKGAKKKGRKNNHTLFNFVNDIDNASETNTEATVAEVSTVMTNDVDEPAPFLQDFAISGSYNQELEDF